MHGMHGVWCMMYMVGHAAMMLMLLCHMMHAMGCSGWMPLVLWGSMDCIPQTLRHG